MDLVSGDWTCSCVRENLSRLRRSLWSNRWAGILFTFWWICFDLCSCKYFTARFYGLIDADGIFAFGLQRSHRSRLFFAFLPPWWSIPSHTLISVQGLIFWEDLQGLLPSLLLVCFQAVAPGEDSSYPWKVIHIEWQTISPVLLAVILLRLGRWGVVVVVFYLLSWFLVLLWIPKIPFDCLNDVIDDRRWRRFE